jgi:plasmid stabilization system protein ParE
MAGSSGEDQEPSIEYTIVLQPEVEEELQEAFDYYESKSPGLGSEFMRAVDACLSFIDRYPLASAEVHKEVRRALLRRFPYGIFYLIDENKIVVIACFHASRNPRQWQRRVE